jgi:hypothetical protein
MRRTSHSSGPPLRSTEEGTFPSKEIIDVFGRFVGIVASTAFECFFTNSGTSSEFPTQLKTSTSDFFNSFTASAPSQDQGNSSRDFQGEGLSREVKSKSETPETEAQAETESEAETETTIESELVELRYRLSGKSTDPGEACDRSIALIRRSTPFFNREGE